MASTHGQSDAPDVTPDRILLVGLGQWGLTWVTVIEDSPYWEAVGYVDRDEARLDLAADRPSVSRSACYTDLASAIDDTDATAVLCAVPPGAHRPVSETALERGLHVLTEKPLAGTLSDATAMVDAADAADRKLMVSQNYRFDAQSRAMRDILDREFVGDPGYVSVRFARKLDSSDITDFRLEMRYPLLRDMSIHHFDQMRYVLDADPVAVSAQSTNAPWSEFDHAPISSAVFEMEDDVLIDYFGSHVSQGEATTWNGDWRVACSGAEVRWRDGDISLLTQSPVHSVEEEWMTEETLPGSADKGVLRADPSSMAHESRDYSLYEFHQSIRSDREPETSARDNVNTLAMVHAAVESCERGDRVTIDELLD